MKAGTGQLLQGHTHPHTGEGARSPDSELFRSLFAKTVPKSALVACSDRYGTEPRQQFACTDMFVVAPATVQQVSEIMRICKDNRISVVPWSGGTGLVGGQTPVGLVRPLLLSLERLNKIRSVDAGNRVLVAEAGCILQDVQAEADRAGFMFPLSLASKGSCRIGGNLATNAGGVHVLRYGTMRDLCLGIEVVLPSGEIWNGLSSLRKDSLGYDLRHLMIGSEGSLGVITAASLKLAGKLRDEATAFVKVPDPSAAIELLSIFRDEFDQQLSAFELVAGTGFQFLSQIFPKLRQPFSQHPDWSVLADVGATSLQEIPDRLAGAMAVAVERKLATDAVIAVSESQRQDFWTLRELIPEANKRIGSISSHDVAVPIASIPAFIDDAYAAITRLGDFRVNCFGHVGDGNLHYNVFPPSGSDGQSFADKRTEVREAVHEVVRTHCGSISAEHGTGRLNASYLETHGDPAFLAAMKAIKTAIDPHNIMNPGSVLEMR